jgi:hypothetical protein
MKKYNTRPIDFTGCHPVIAEHLKRGEAIECRLWDHKNHAPRVGLVVGFTASNAHPYRCDNAGSSIYRHAEPIPIKVKRIMPPERAIQALIAEGWAFTSTGHLSGPGVTMTPQMYALMGEDLDGEASKFAWPSCIIEEEEDDE